MIPKIRKMFCIHDYLYSKRSRAEKYNDGKDYVKERFIIVTSESDLSAEEMSAYDHITYSDFNDAVRELRILVNDMKEWNKTNETF
ncbi:hypothetical protein M3596_22235 [Bacillus subtilis]|uniref:hypothetical protein n=1 Tax=Bacillus subtilis TaxID=1423 RepID=UPI00203D99A8|nr:hypothetical protein [Bacillus subtilis]MCM3191431.1 hypothetical protein [Bacillus subtilis]